jgi:hypothetical protein
VDNLIAQGAGAFEAGEGPAGADPLATPSAVVTQAPVGALHFDPFQRTYTRNDDLSMIAGSGPIQRAAHLLLPLGSLPATPNSGLDVLSIKRALPIRRQRAIEDALRVTWASLLNSNQIAMGKVTLEPVASGRSWSGKFDVEITDLVTQTTTTITGST